MSSIKEITESYDNLPLADRIMFYLCVSNDLNVCDETKQAFLIEKRMTDNTCIHCQGSHVVKNGHRADGTQRFICRDCRKSFIPSSNSVVSGTRKRLEVWARYINCMIDKKALEKSAIECKISKNTAFTWKHKILGVLKELTDKTFLTQVLSRHKTIYGRELSKRPPLPQAV